MPKFKLEEFLLPWERDDDGKKLDEPKEIDVEKLRKWVYGLLSDKETAVEERATAVTEKENAENNLKELQQKNETDDQRRQREQTERDRELEQLKADGIQRRKLDAITEAFEKDGITAAQAKKLAKRVSGDEKDWIADAKELVEDGFKVGTTKTSTEAGGEGEVEETLDSTPRVMRNGRVVPPKDASKPKSVAEELDAAGIGRTTW